eukprot:6192461-Pleurochrysis_carterae.AAC.1
MPKALLVRSAPFGMSTMIGRCHVPSDSCCLEKTVLFARSMLRVGMKFSERTVSVAFGVK